MIRVELNSNFINKILNLSCINENNRDQEKRLHSLTNFDRNYL